MAVQLFNPSGETFLHKGPLNTTSDAVVTAAPLTMFCWFNPSVAPNFLGSMMAIMREPPSLGGYEYFDLALTGANPLSSAEPLSVTAGTRAVFVIARASSASQFSTNTWQSAAAVFTSSTSRKAYLNGVPGPEDVNAVTPTVLEQTYIGAQTTTYPTDHTWAYNGCLCHCAWWDVALTDAEIVQLNEGATPDEVRPEHLVYYVPMVDEATKAQAFAWNGIAVAAVADMHAAGSYATCADAPDFETPPSGDTSTDQPTTIETEQEYVVRQFIPFERPPFIEFNVTDDRDTFPVPFGLMDQESLRVTVDHAELAQDAFTFTGIVDEYRPNKRGGSLVLVADAEDAIVRIWADPTPARETDLSRGEVNATNLNSAFETAWRIHLAHRYHLKRTQVLGPEALAQINETMSGNLFVI